MDAGAGNRQAAAPDAEIRDQDLIAELEAVRGTARFEFLKRALVVKQAERDRLAKLKPGALRRSRARERIEADGIAQENLRHIHSVLAICSLPYTRQPVEVREYERRHGRMNLVVEAGKLQAPDGQWVLQPLPHGSRARLLLLHLCSEAIRQKSPTIQIEDSLTAFIRAIGFPVTGGHRGTLTAFKQQINALAACSMQNAHRRLERLTGQHDQHAAVFAARCLAAGQSRSARTLALDADLQPRFLRHAD